MHHSRPRGHCLFTSLITALEIIVVQNCTEFGEGNVRNLKGQRAQTVVNKIIKFISLLSWEAMVAVVLLLCQVPIPSKETPVSSPYCFFFCMTILQWTWCDPRTWFMILSQQLSWTSHQHMNSAPVLFFFFRFYLA